MWEVAGKSKSAVQECRSVEKRCLECMHENPLHEIDTGHCIAMLVEGRVGGECSDVVRLRTESIVVRLRTESIVVS